ncbi:hypothetical protein ACF1AE_19400 [Streptomyces sp. NPDC014986]|uniref:hypothetical protein n=1 Tax=Streptomyces sp. NPDC014986 TaxID=3364934 RepID=UPI0036FB655D
MDTCSASAVRVFDTDGKIVCREGGPCRPPAAGTYTASSTARAPSSYTGNGLDGLLLLDRASDAGCVVTETDSCKGESNTVGRDDCLTLDAPQSSSVTALTPIAATGANAAGAIVSSSRT